MTNNLGVGVLLSICIPVPLHTSCLTLGKLLNALYLRRNKSTHLIVLQDFPGGTVVKKSSCKCRRHSLSLGQKGLLEQETATQFQYSCLENPMDRGAWWLLFIGLQKVTIEHAHAQGYNELILVSTQNIYIYIYIYNACNFVVAVQLLSSV